MISHPERKNTAGLIDKALKAGAVKEKACREAGISSKTYNRWVVENQIKEDGRPGAERPVPANKLSTEEKEEIIKVCNSIEFESLPPTQIVPALADRGEYLASESTFYRTLKEYKQLNHRGRSKKSEKREPVSHCAVNPCEVWSWDITWLKGPIKGIFFFLYMIIDIYSRKIVGWEVYDSENSDYASEVIRKAVISEKCFKTPFVLHSDNGSPMKGATFLETLRKLDIQPSYGRPGVSNDNSYSESLFKTCKYRPKYPVKGFETIESAREWCLTFVRWYNNNHKHSKIGFVTPNQRHNGDDEAIFENRKTVFETARKRHPERWSRQTRKWEKPEKVWLNPVKEPDSKEVNIVKTAA